MTDGEIRVLHSWLDPQKVDGQRGVNVDAAMEARAVYKVALKEAGQTEMDLDPEMTKAFD